MAYPFSKHVKLTRRNQKWINTIACDNSKPIYKLSPQEARKVLENLQNKYPVDVEADIVDKTITTEEGDIEVRIVRPVNNTELLPVILYLHGGGWIMGDKNTHNILISELANKTNAVIIFPQYIRSPEAGYPVALNQSYGVLDYIYNHPEEFNIDKDRIAIAGDSAGANMATVLTMKVKENNGPYILIQALFYPVTSADMNTQSYKDFKDGPWLTKKAMEWFWDAYAPEQYMRDEPYISPLNADIKLLNNLPPALIITAENDVLRDEGEEYARKLDNAGVPVLNVRFNGTMHDFMMLHALHNTEESTNAILLASQVLKTALHK